ncbi:hypothetical protein HME9304_02136 [Flagellimonas maritima]|uniref:Uncharacterized protein n=1 Tax=Flagellimonas maritima TaxID=1383885 RepID=A0A2Z4LTJ5_9FLAO|nr:hypothetical protein [Allomuricauda aurantiaca]AWX45126.1 hypothetical protein HME9304_02136 [Allomuricauda aurantiaca]
MYFEDFYYKIEPLWNRSFTLEGIEETETYFRDIKQNYTKIEGVVDFSNKEEYSEWEKMLVFTMYQTLTAFGLEKWKKQKAKTLNFDEIPIRLFEEYFKKNLEPEDEFEGNEEYLEQYKGLKAAASK